MEAVVDRKGKVPVGRYVRLKYRTFEKVVRRAKETGALENLFVVAAIARGVNKLICYGSNIRVVVSPSDVVLI